MKKEIRALTGVRGVAALFVACYHFLEPFNPNWPPLFRDFFFHGYLSVDLFFILSGFVMSLSSRKLFDNGVTGPAYGTFMKRRFARIYPIYFVLSVVYFILKFKMKGWLFFGINLTLLQILDPRVYTIIGPSWSLSAEWVIYLLFPFLLLLIYRFRSRAWAIGCLLAGFGLLVFVATNNSEFLNGVQKVPRIEGDLNRYRSLSALLRCLAEYIIGITFYKAYAEYYPTYSKYYHYAALPTTLLILVCLFINNSDLLLTLLFAVLIFSCSTDTGIVARFLGWTPVYFLGEISYSLYLMHEIVISTDRYIFKHYYSGSYLRPVNISIYLLALLSLSWLTYKLIEVPARRSLRRRLETPAMPGF